MSYIHHRFKSPSIVRIGVLLFLVSAFTAGPLHCEQVPASRSALTVVTCVSKQGQREVCKADTAAGVALMRSTGEANCLLGRNWGYDDAGVWVTNGCGGEFVVGSTHEAGGPPPAAAATRNTGGTQEPTGASNFVGMLEPYGQIRTHFAAFKNDAEVQDNATRIGIHFATRGKIKVIAGTEWGVNLVQSENQFNLSASGSTPEFGVLTTHTNEVFLARLGFAGVDFGWGGKVTVGKQYAPHYDIAGYTTDRFNVFGGQGTFAYVAGTDGGVTGTGRADRVVQYRNTIAKIVEVGLQGQFRAAGNDHTTDGGGASLQVTVLPGVKLGGTYTRTNWGPAIQQQIRGTGGNADYFAVGGRIDWRLLQFGGVYAHQHNGDLATVPVTVVGQPAGNATVAFDANGFELFARVGIGRFGLIGGYTSQDPKVGDPLLNPDFKTRYFIIGGEWFFAKSGRIYSEGRIDNGSVTATGDKGYDVFTIGFRYDFTLRLSHEQ